MVIVRKKSGQRTNPMNRLLLISLVLFLACEDKQEKIYGCTDPTACNFNSDATIFDNSCWYAVSGCECSDGKDAFCLIGTYTLTTFAGYNTPDCSGSLEENLLDNYISVILTLNADRSATIVTTAPDEDVTTSFLWTASDDEVTFIYSGGYQITYTLLGNTLTVDSIDDGYCMEEVWTKN